MRKAISIAGGFKERASREKINIIRDDDASQIAPEGRPEYPAHARGYPDTIEESFFWMNDLTLQERLRASAQRYRAAEDETLDIVEYWRAISKRRWSILGLTLLVAILAALIVSTMRPSYRSTATLLIEQGKTKVVSIEEVYSAGLIQREYYQTQVEILKSEELARKVVQKLKLTTHPDYDPQAIAAALVRCAWMGVSARCDGASSTR